MSSYYTKIATQTALSGAALPFSDVDMVSLCYQMACGMVRSGVLEVILFNSITVSVIS